MTILKTTIKRPHDPAMPRPQGQAQRMMPLPDEWQPGTLSISKLRDEAEAQLVSRIHARLAATLGRSIDTAAPESLRARLSEAFPLALGEERVDLNRTARLRLPDAV